MFTGIVAAKSAVVSLEPRAAGALLTLRRPPAFGDVAAGESIAVSGVCLTALPEPGRGPLRFDLSPETLSRSTLGALGKGKAVNLERALAAGDRFGGHVVAGHVDATTPLTRIARAAEFWTVSFALGRDWARYVVEKGSIALDGISLTVAALREDEFDVAVIPHTLEVTTLGERSPGDRVNVEVDLIGKYVERMLEGRLAPASADGRLRELLSS